MGQPDIGNQSYAGDITSQEAWQVLREDEKAVLVDVRTRPEWAFVGLPDLSSVGQRPHCIEWQIYPEMAINAHFAATAEKAEIGKDATILLLCRSGARSRSAAVALTQAGFKSCFNISDGFEGPCDGDGHRGTQAGWKEAGLPWKQG